MSDDRALSTEGEALCECCGKLRMCRMYMLPDCTTALVCKPCRNGEKDMHDCMCGRGETPCPDANSNPLCAGKPT